MKYADEPLGMLSSSANAIAVVVSTTRKHFVMALRSDWLAGICCPITGLSEDFCGFHGVDGPSVHCEV